MLKLSTDLVRHKNLLVDTGAWIVLIEVRDRNDDPLTDQIRICSNLEEIEWPTGSDTKWTPYPFEVGSFEENIKNETGTTTLKICPSKISVLLSVFSSKSILSILPKNISKLDFTTK